jgi:hypothetical protein
MIQKLDKNPVINIYQIRNDQEDDIPKFIFGAMKKEELERLIFYFQCKVYGDITDILFLDKDAIIKLLIKYYGFREERMILVNSHIDKIDLIDIWNRRADDFENVINDPGYADSEVENEILDAANNYPDRFLFINAAARLPKWAEEIHLEPLSLSVTHGGVLIQGLHNLLPEDRKRILSFYPKCRFFDDDKLFFSFKSFPAYNYSFGWNGRHITISEVEETEDKPTELIRQMNIGYYLNNIDFKFPINSMKEFSIIMKKMRLL